MLRTSIVLTFVTLVVVSKFPQSSSCASSSCGDIHNISYRFRLQTDPITCGKTSYQLSCEHNLTVLYLFSQKYYVKAINYNNFTIRLIDATVQTYNCSSLPRYSLTESNFSFRDAYDTNKFYRRTIWDVSEIPPKIIKPINFLSCPYGVHSPLYVDAAPCLHGNDSWRRNYLYAKLGRLNASDVRDSCTIELMVMTSFPVKDDGYKFSIWDIHNALLYGFELSWFKGHCKSCTGGEPCYFEDADNVICYPSYHFGNK